MKRLPPIAGEWIDRTRSRQFTFEGKAYSGFAGDVISSALAAAGIRVLGRSFKYHRARGLLSLANHDVNVLLQSGAQLNVRADVSPLTAGAQWVAVNTQGGVEHDRARLMQHFGRFLPVGFYYKAFHSRRWFAQWERRIRSFAGLGVIDEHAARQRTAKRYDFCDVLVVGGGVAGLHAALAAADAGAKVAIVDENARLGGSGLYNLGASDAARVATQTVVDRVIAHPRIKTYLSTYAVGYYADHWVPLVEQHRITKMRARAVIVAAGAIEQPAVFGNNDLPGVMLASGAQRLIYRYAVAPGTRAVVLAANNDAYRAALDLLAHGIEVTALVDLRAERADEHLSTAVRDRGVAIKAAFGVYEAEASGGVLSSAIIAPFAGASFDLSRRERISCDLLLMSVGWSPALHLLYQAGTKMRFDTRLSQFVPEVFPEGVFACGRVAGHYGDGQKIASGRQAGQSAAVYLGFNAEVEVIPPDDERPSHEFPIFAHPGRKNFVDFDEDLHLQDFFNAAQEGFDNIELLKRFTTVGMGPSQGKHSNMNAIRILAKIRGEPIERIGSTTARPMYHPVPMAHLAGRGFNVERDTPLHAQHAALGAKFMLAGQWRRPEYYARSGVTREACIHDEVRAVRRRAGIIDVGTLGKIEVRGVDAGAFLERVYCGRFARLKVGMTRYGLMVDESGVIIDDGVIARLADDHFYFTTTTSGSATVYRELVRLNTIWGMRVGIVNLTGHLGAVNLAGPDSRMILAQLTSIDLAEARFPYLGVRTGDVAGVNARVMRVGFVGELGYEIHAPADSMEYLWERLFTVAHSLIPFGVEAQRILRLEKGHLIIGQDTDGLTSPAEAGAQWAVAMDKAFFVGQRSLDILSRQPPRQRLIGFTLLKSTAPTPKECHLVIHNGDIAGRVTSIAWSPTLQRVIGLALLTPELAALGTPFDIRVEGGVLVQAVVTPTPFYDAMNERQHEPVAA